MIFMPPAGGIKTLTATVWAFPVRKLLWPLRAAAVPGGILAATPRDPP